MRRFSWRCWAPLAMQMTRLGPAPGGTSRVFHPACLGGGPVGRAGLCSARAEGAACARHVDASDRSLVAIIPALPPPTHTPCRKRHLLACVASRAWDVPPGMVQPRGQQLGAVTGPPPFPPYLCPCPRRSGAQGAKRGRTDTRGPLPAAQPTGKKIRWESNSPEQQPVRCRRGQSGRPAQHSTAQMLC
jgi:hypothetical protein